MSDSSAGVMTPQEVLGEQVLSDLRGKTILLAGATGKNGSAVREQFSELGIKVRATSRNAAKARDKYGDQHDWVSADVTDAGTLDAAVRGVDVVVWAVATARPFGANRPEKIDYQGSVNLANAAKAAGVSRMVMITSSLSGKEDHFLNWFGKMLIWKGKGEDAVMSSGLEYVVIGPTAIEFEAGGSQPIVLCPRADYVKGQKIKSGDLASVVIAATVTPAAANRVFSVSNGDGSPDPDWQRQFATMPAR